MKKTVFVFLMAFTGLCSAGHAIAIESSLESSWRMAHVLKIDFAESMPPQYQLSFELRCDETDFQTVSFVRGDAIVMGVAVKRDSSRKCTRNEPAMRTERVILEGSLSDPGKIQVLR
ncbi:MAG: hypothetical protein AB1540_01875 [Bdellovibrionota bacterium]